MHSFFFTFAVFPAILGIFWMMKSQWTVLSPRKRLWAKEFFLKKCCWRTITSACSFRINKFTVNIFLFEAVLIIRKNNKSCFQGFWVTQPLLPDFFFNDFDFKRFEDTVDNWLLFAFSVLWGQTPHQVGPISGWCTQAWCFGLHQTPASRQRTWDRNP